MKRFPRISLTCKLVPVQYREYENGLFPLFSYDHIQWEKDYPVRGSADDTESLGVLQEIPAKQVTSKETKLVSFNQVSFSSLARTDNVTRGQIAAVKLPKVAFINNKMLY